MAGVGVYVQEAEAAAAVAALHTAATATGLHYGAADAVTRVVLAAVAASSVCPLLTLELIIRIGIHEKLT